MLFWKLEKFEIFAFAVCVVVQEIAKFLGFHVGIFPCMYVGLSLGAKN